MRSVLRAAIDGMADCAAAAAPLSSPAPKAHRCADINRPTPLRIGCSDCLRHVVRLVAPVLRSLEGPIAAIPVQVLRTHFGRQLVEWLRTESSVLGAGSHRSNTVSFSLQRSDYVRRMLGWITARGFIDGIRDDPLDGPTMFFSHALLLVPHMPTTLCTFLCLPTSGDHCNHWLMVPRSGHEP